MAILTPLSTVAPMTDPEAIRAWLAARGVSFEVWDLPAEAAELGAKAALDDDDKARLLALFAERLREKADRDGYRSADVVAIRPTAPGVADALAKFDRVHFHDDDEVRAIVGGTGIFGFVGDDGRQFILQMFAGEYISLPAGVWHWFYCTPEMNVTALRLFRDEPAWVAHYRSTERGTSRA
jgi:1,2-dihydroxy-3-keto-5-methylthiopentene dioxygenase